LIGGALGGMAAWKLLQPELVQRGPSRFLASATPNVAALVTGASAGIGEAFARRLAREGYDLVLVARRKARLEMLAEDLKKRHAIRAQALVADLANPADIERVARTAADLSDAGRLDLLINNAGFGTIGYFADVPMHDQLTMLNVHVTAAIQLTHAALPGMLKRKRGGIVNVSSTAGWFPLPGSVNYNATKRYLITFSEALHYELDGSGVVVQALCPGFTYSEFHDTPPYRAVDFRRDAFPAFMWQTADQVAEASLNQLGTGNAVCVPGVHNRVLVMLSDLRSLVPPSVMREARWSIGGFRKE
jgi:short-subunit dehydrogenase